MTHPTEQMRELIVKWKAESADENCELHSGVGYTAHIPSKCPACVTDAHVKELEALSLPEREPRDATTQLVKDFAQALSEKLAAAEKKYGYSENWKANDWMDECRKKLREHAEKGDPRDVAAYCAFLWYHGESTALAGASPVHDCALEVYKRTLKGASPVGAISPKPAWRDEDLQNRINAVVDDAQEAGASPVAEGEPHG